MTPAQFLTLIKVAPDATPRAYRAVAEGGNETFLTLHTATGRFECPTYAQLSYISGDDRGGTVIRLIFSKMSVVIAGRQLGAVFESIRTRKAAHLYEFDGGRYNPPEPGEPVIMEFGFLVERALGAQAARGSSGNPEAYLSEL